MGDTQWPSMKATTGTKEAYRAAGHKLAVRWCGAGAANNAAAVCDQFLQRARSRMYAKATLRLYKEQILEYVKTLDHSPALIAAVRNLHVASLATTEKEKKTASLKLQSVKSDEATKLLQYMRGCEFGSNAYKHAANMFEASLWLGLRPVEWTQTKMEVMRPEWLPDVINLGEGNARPTHKITVVNAKHNGVRGNSPQRVIYATLTLEQAQVLIACIEAARQHKHGWHAWYKQLCNCLYYAGKKLWPRRKKVPCFYTARHQCIANAKQTGGLPNTLAAIFGHASDATARKHYSRASNGDKKMCLISASTVSLDAVRNQRMTSLAMSNDKHPSCSPKGNAKR